MDENEAKCIQLSWKQCQQNAWRKASCTFFYICKLLLAQGCKWSWILNAMELRLSSLCAFVFILIVSLKYVPLYVGDVKSQFVYVHCKQETVVAMWLYIWVFRSLLSAILKENVRKILSKNSGSADRWILCHFECGFRLARDSYRPAGQDVFKISRTPWAQGCGPTKNLSASFSQGIRRFPTCRWSSLCSWKLLQTEWSSFILEDACLIKMGLREVRWS